MDGSALTFAVVVLAFVYVVHPLFARDIDAPWDQIDLLDRDSGSTQPRSGTGTNTAVGESRRAMTDGGHVCHNCGAYVDGDYLYCAECLIPRV